MLLWHVKRCNIWYFLFILYNFLFVLYNFLCVLYKTPFIILQRNVFPDLKAALWSRCQVFKIRCEIGIVVTYGMSNVAIFDLSYLYCIMSYLNCIISYVCCIKPHLYCIISYLYCIFSYLYCIIFICIV